MKLQDISEGLEELEDRVENLDNIQKKNNLKFRGLKESIEGDNLKSSLEGLFTTWMGTGSNAVIFYLFYLFIFKFLSRHIPAYLSRQPIE